MKVNHYPESKRYEIQQDPRAEMLYRQGIEHAMQGETALFGLLKWVNDHKISLCDGGDYKPLMVPYCEGLKTTVQKMRGHN